MAATIKAPPPFYTAGAGATPVVSASELERNMARATMTLGAGLLSAGAIWALSNNGGPRSLIMMGGILSAFGWAWLSRTGGLDVEPQGVTIEGELV